MNPNFLNKSSVYIRTYEYYSVPSFLPKSVVKRSDSETGETCETKPGGEKEEDYWKVELHPHPFKSFFQRVFMLV